MAECSRHPGNVLPGCHYCRTGTEPPAYSRNESGRSPHKESFEEWETGKKETWKDGFRAAVLRMLRDKYHLPAIEVTGVEDQASSYENSLGGCETDYECDIFYRTADGRLRMYTYIGRFASLIEELTEE